MKMCIACAFAAVLSLSGCSEDIKGGGGDFPFGPNNPLNVSGSWMYEGTVVSDECGSLFCSECHDAATKFGECDPWDPSDPWYKCIQGMRVIVQDGEDLFIFDHIISTAMGVEMEGSIRMFSGDFLCGRSVEDESGTSILYIEDGTFHSNDLYESSLTLSSSRDGPLCKVIWKVIGRRAD